MRLLSTTTRNTCTEKCGSSKSSSVGYFNSRLFRYAVDEELLQKIGADPEEDIYMSDELYQQPNAFEGAKLKATTNVVCRTLYQYTATQPDELSFPAGATITNVIKKDGGWWQGDHDGKIGGWLPSNYVEEVLMNTLSNYCD